MGLTRKQRLVIDAYNKYKPRMLILHGAKRSGKTFTNNLLFLEHVAKFNDENKDFILGGSSTNSIFRNVVGDFEKLLGYPLKQTKKGYIWLFGNKVHILGGEKKGSHQKARGFTSYGTYLNEMTTLEKIFVEECVHRTSPKEARIFCDTNTDSPLHYVKTDYIDKCWQYGENGELNGMEISWTLYDNTTLSNEYISYMEKTTASGTSYDRHINGLWVSSDGVVYADFTKENIIEEIDEEIKDYFLGIDWGYEHYGAVALLGISNNDNIYLVDYVAEREKYYEWWSEIIKKYIYEYDIRRIYVDGARPEYFAKTKEVSRQINPYIIVKNANKSVSEGIDCVGSLFKQNKFLIPRSKLNGRFLEEINNYKYNSVGEPIKQYDDLLDSIRYGVFSYLIDKRKQLLYGGIEYRKGIR